MEPKLLEVVMDKSTLQSTTICLCLDLSKPQNVIVNLLRYLTLVKEVISRRVSELQATNVNALNTLRGSISSAYASHPDISRIRPLEVGLVVIANKYAALRALQSGEKRLLMQCLRFVCHYFGASLLCSELNEGSSKDAYRAAISALAFGQAIKPINEVADKHVLITRAMDSYEAILLGANLQGADGESGKVKVGISIIEIAAG